MHSRENMSLRLTINHCWMFWVFTFFLHLEQEEPRVLSRVFLNAQNAFKLHLYLHFEEIKSLRKYSERDRLRKNASTFNQPAHFSSRIIFGNTKERRKKSPLTLTFNLQLDSDFLFGKWNNLSKPDVKH